MFVKSTGIKGGGKRLLEYISRPDAVLKQDDKVLYIKQHIAGSTIQDFLKAFEENEKLRLHPGVNRNKFYHDFLSFSPDSSEFLTPEVMADLARKYMELRAEYGIGVAVAHIEGKHHRHLHVVMGGCEYASGESIRVTRGGFAKIKQDLQKYQQEKYPELAASVVQHGKGIKRYETDDEVQMKNRTGKPSRRDELRELLNTVFDESISKEDFYNRITEDKGLSVYSRNGQVVGIEENERRYRFTNLGVNIEHIEELQLREERLEELKDIGEDKVPQRSIELLEAEFEEEIAAKKEGIKGENYLENNQKEAEL